MKDRRRDASSGFIRDHLACCVRGDAVPWCTLDTSGEALLAACDGHGVTGLVYRQLRRAPSPWDWPAAVVRELADRSRQSAVLEEVRRRETASVLEALSAAGVRPVLLKGTPLAYTVYDAPPLRPRCDTDLIVARGQVEDVRRVLAKRGYAETPLCDGEGLFCQFEVQRTDELGVLHALDVHWKVSTQSMFAEMLTYDELSAGSIPVPGLGTSALAPATHHALLLACVHPAMHHRNEARLIWSMDVHQLVARCSPGDLATFAALAVAKRVAVVCAHELRRATSTFGTVLPAGVMARLESPPSREPSAVYLHPSRRWHNELMSNLHGLTGWRNRVGLLREVLLPAPRYMMRAYGVNHGWMGLASLPALYLHRGAHGAWKVLSGTK